MDDKVMLLQDIKNGYDAIMTSIPIGLKNALLVNDEW